MRDATCPGMTTMRTQGGWVSHLERTRMSLWYRAMYLSLLWFSLSEKVSFRQYASIIIASSLCMGPFWASHIDFVSMCNNLSQYILIQRGHMPGTLDDWISRPHLTFTSLLGEVYVWCICHQETMAQQGSRHEAARECIRKEENGLGKMFSLFFLCIFHVTKR